MLVSHFGALLEYNRWANRLILSQAARVAPEDYFAVAPGLSFGSMHATLVHILVGELVWLARWQGGLPPERLKDARVADRLAAEEVRTFEEVTSMWGGEDAKQVRFIEGLTDGQLTSKVVYRTQYGERNEQPLHELIAHLVNHGTQFRAEACVRLTQLGLSPGDIDLIIYLRQRG